MKSYLFILLLGSGILLAGCENAQQPDLAGVESTSTQNTLVGAWEFVSASAALPDTVLRWNNISDRAGIFFYSDSHWGFIASNPEGSELLFAGRGTYSINGNKYTENAEFHTGRPGERTSTEFEFEVVGDTLIKVGYIPVWDGVREMAGDMETVRLEEIRVRANKDAM